MVTASLRGYESATAAVTIPAGNAGTVQDFELQPLAPLGNAVREEGTQLDATAASAQATAAAAIQVAAEDSAQQL